jgi:hypothetical protein
MTRKVMKEPLVVDYDPDTRLPLGGLISFDLPTNRLENGCGRGTSVSTSRAATTTSAMITTVFRVRWPNLAGVGGGGIAILGHYSAPESELS